jgi:hypothetical protein
MLNNVARNNQNIHFKLAKHVKSSNPNSSIVETAKHIQNQGTMSSNLQCDLDLLFFNLQCQNNYMISKHVQEKEIINVLSFMTNV